MLHIVVISSRGSSLLSSVILFYRAAIEAYRREPEGPRRVQLLQRVRDIEYEILDEMREETLRIHQENENMEAALILLQAREDGSR